MMNQNHYPHPDTPMYTIVKMAYAEDQYMRTLEEPGFSETIDTQVQRMPEDDRWMYRSTIADMLESGTPTEGYTAFNALASMVNSGKKSLESAIAEAQLDIDMHIHEDLAVSRRNELLASAALASDRIYRGYWSGRVHRQTPSRMLPGSFEGSPNRK